MIKQIAVAVYVEDQQKAKQFWTEKVGLILQPTTRWDLEQAGWRLRQKVLRLV